MNMSYMIPTPPCILSSEVYLIPPLFQGGIPVLLNIFIYIYLLPPGLLVFIYIYLIILPPERG